MAIELRHVRFRLSDLIQAVQAVRGDIQPLSVDQALTWYWNWAVRRGWQLQMIANQLHSANLCSRIEHGDQMEWTPEESWNVVWKGEDTDGGPDLVAESSILKMSAGGKMIMQELFRRGWSVRLRTGGGRSGAGVLERLDVEGRTHAIFVDDVEAFAEHFGEAGVTVNLEDIVFDLEA